MVTRKIIGEAIFVLSVRTVTVNYPPTKRKTKDQDDMFVELAMRKVNPTR